jgi:excisionase family DNA binding protein
MSARDDWREPRQAAPAKERLLKAAEVARRLQVSPRTVTKWAQDGKLRVLYTPGGHLRIPESALDDLMVPRNERTGQQATGEVRW